MTANLSGKKSYTKPPLNHDDMIGLLRERGLSLWNENRVKQRLQHTGYYRLSAYFKSFQYKNDTFFSWTTFDEVWDSYIFDRKLRLHTLNAIEKIEVSLKANMNDILSLKKWCFWYLDKTNFDLTPRKSSKHIVKQPADIHKELMDKIEGIKKSGREIVKYYQSKYDTEDLPSRILFQELTIGEISNIYNIFPTATRQEIANVYGVYERDFKARIQTLNNIRNICAHHGRLWNRRYVFKVRANDTTLKSKFQKQKNIRGYAEVLPNYYNLALILIYLLRRINKKFDWLSDLRKLLKSHKNKYNKRMWLNRKWYKNI